MYKNTCVKALPALFIVQLMVYDAYGTKMLNLNIVLDDEICITTDNGDSVQYELKAVVVHSGTALNSGHYYANVKTENGSIYRADDLTIGVLQTMDAVNDDVYDTPYMLFYQQSEIVTATKIFATLSLTPSSLPFNNNNNKNNYGSNRNNDHLSMDHLHEADKKYLLEWINIWANESYSMKNCM